MANEGPWSYAFAALQDPAQPIGVNMSFLTIPAPVRSPLTNGLFSVLTFPETSARWQLGVSLETKPCGFAPVLTDAACAAPGAFSGYVMDPVGSSVPAEEEWSRFTAYGPYKCSPMGNSLGWAQEQARAFLMTTEQTSVEAVMWSQFAAKIPVTPAFTKPEAVIGDLEQNLGWTYSATGIIHVSLSMATYLLRYDVIERSGTKLQTKLGTPVVAGAGYGITAPNMIVSTPALAGFRSDVYEPEDTPSSLFTTSRNDLHGLAARDYLVGYEQCGFRVVTLERN